MRHKTLMILVSAGLAMVLTTLFVQADGPTVLSSLPWVGAEEVGKLYASDGAAYENFGSSVALDGDTMVTGAFYDDDNGWTSGSAYVFVRDASGDWTEQAKLLASDGAQDDHFGYSGALDGDTVVFGALGDSSAYVFRLIPELFDAVPSRAVPLEQRD